jgi:hypothetical protein
MSGKAVWSLAGGGLRNERHARIPRSVHIKS